MHLLFLIVNRILSYLWNFSLSLSSESWTITKLGIVVTVATPNQPRPMTNKNSTKIKKPQLLLGNPIFHFHKFRLLLSFSIATKCILQSIFYKYSLNTKTEFFRCTHPRSFALCSLAHTILQQIFTKQLKKKIKDTLQCSSNLISTKDIAPLYWFTIYDCVRYLCNYFKLKFNSRLLIVILP